MNKLITKKSLFTIACLLFVSFIYYSYLVAKEKFSQLDFDLTVKLQDKIPAKFDLPFSFFSILGSVEVTGVIWFLVLITLLIKRFWLSALALFLLPLALAIELFGKLFVHHPAPPYLFYRGVLDVQFPLNFTQTDYSYPSGHETRTAFLIVFLMSFFFFRQNFFSKLLIQPLLVGVLLIMTISRIYLGEHWTTDVLGGFLIGASFGLFAGITVPKKTETNEAPST
ncbi:phosphatase PAP2 family protein [Candidatus Daviesbacteria bacterium]|nr:phosphatase PAP2 family protein [Candidatus Daviesbacteria bacterium]